MNMQDPKDWFRLLQIREGDSADLITKMNEQVQLMTRAKYPHTNDYKNEEVPAKYGARLDALTSDDTPAFDPTLPIAALSIWERALRTATVDVGGRLVADTLLAHESDEQLRKRWSDWFDNGDYWPRLVKQNWVQIVREAAVVLEEWAKGEGMRQVDGASEVVSAVASSVRELSFTDIVPADLIKSTGMDGEERFGSDW
ncbi:hypothetical protein [Azoarcus taiwanensis]|uniref:Uncharacterized protein n=1 Tax=Azoarcus taiwanensis TaxID=666964 RepID=A0A972J8D4_9RHOO|nr:hypothetical protein [Azoarcus taiwanensis]NMG03051.1 hypothetical protein [Azoarcus taiwanensis]